MIYLDNNSTTRIHPEVVSAMVDCYQSQYVNPASQHAAGRMARKRLEEAREGISRILGARCDTSHPDRLIFTSGGTESNNLALRGLVQSTGYDVSRRFILSTVEHPSLSESGALLESQGHNMELAPVDSEGVIDLEKLEALINASQDPGVEVACVSIMMGNNETGVIQPIQSVVNLCQPYGIPVHTDAVQCVAKVPVSFEQLEVDALSLTAHKFHGPRGIGALLLRNEVELMPLMIGGGQQLGTRPGTESVALAVGMWQALKIWRQESDQVREKIEHLRDKLQSSLLHAIPEIIVNGGRAQRLPHTLNVAFPGVDRQAMMLALDRANIACSTGSACTSGSSEPSPVLIAMGCDKAIVNSSLRFSLSAETTPAEVAEAVGRIVEIARKIKSFSTPEKTPFAAR